MSQTTFRYMALVLMVPALSQAAARVNVPALGKLVSERAATVAQWESAALFQTVLTVSAVVFGALVTFLQHWNSRTWCKVATGALGLATAVATGVTAKAFPVDYRLYQKSALQARAKLNCLRDIIHRLEAGPNEQEELELTMEFTQKLRQIQDIEAKLTEEGDAWVSGASLFPTSIVHAQSNKPNWAENPPQAQSSVFFAGEGTSRSLSEAKAKSVEAALRRSAQLLTKQSKSASAQTALDFARAVGEVVDTRFDFDARSRTYTYYTLVRLDRILAEPSTFQNLARPLAKVRLRLTSITVEQDGSVGDTEWTFQLSRNGAKAASLPPRRYNDKTGKVVAGADINLPPLEFRAGEDAMLRIEGRSAGGVAIFGTLSLSADQVAPGRGYRVPVMHTDQRRGSFMFEFQLAP